ncbi:hypothetical protein AQUCO_02300135v1 [Aquilegia coerulea]|uniref:J domain-containing protein n=1 Tax=Aquilegia coerulea TaxID=218851 RepID=A0A2G5DCD8_AQUCA|nr:hypothetical protein AQUCO_02300135v1 [Aquilegia coerulea]
MQIPKLKTLFILRRNSISPSHYVYFHSTSAVLANYWSKWESGTGRGQQPPNSFVSSNEKKLQSDIRFSTHYKRPDPKKALKDLLFKNGCSIDPFEDVSPRQDIGQTNTWNADEQDNSHGSNKKSRSKKSRRLSRAGKGKPRQQNFCADFDEDWETSFQAKYRKRSCKWSSRSDDGPSFQSSSAEFVWRDQSNWTSNRGRVWDSTNETDDDEVKSCIVGSYSDRLILGLPPTGPLKIEDVKNAFRSSAQKWHPDKHQGLSQGEAEEKFKQCVDAYKSLCKALP